MRTSVSVFERVDLEVELPRAACAPYLARWVLRSWCSEHIAGDLLLDAELMVSELGTNALLHGQGRIILRVYLDEDRLLVAVSDQGCGLDHRLCRRTAEQIGGWGLHIVQDLSSGWGVHEGPTDVWFELARRGSAKPASLSGHLQPRPCTDHDHHVRRPGLDATMSAMTPSDVRSDES
jgi:anti-sigma regulatory factor (Ser/Thr protein kinase)